MAHLTDHMQRTQASGRGPPRGLLLEAGLEIAVYGTAILILCARGPALLSDAGIALALLAYATIGILILRGLGHHRPHRHFGLANSITLARAGLSAILLALAADTLVGGDPLADPATRWAITAAAAFSLMLDGVDGWTARRSGMTSQFGAQFDMQTDALFILTLTALIAASGIAGPWVLVSGLMFYAFLIAGAIWPVLTQPLPPRWRRKAVCVAQTALLIAALAPPMPDRGVQLACLIGLALLLWSFGIDLVWLLVHRPSKQQSE